MILWHAEQEVNTIYNTDPDHEKKTWTLWNRYIIDKGLMWKQLCVG